MNEFERDYLPALRKWAGYFFSTDEDKHANALSYGWYRWSRLKGKRVAPDRLARVVCLEVRRGGGHIGTRSYARGVREAMTRADRYGEAGWWRDSRPPGRRTAAARDALAYLYRVTNDHKRAALELMERGILTRTDLAVRLGVTAQTVGAWLATLARLLRAQGW